MDSDMRAGATVLGFGFFGIIVSMILYTLNDRGIFVDEWLQSATFDITELMIVVVILFLVLGVVVAMFRS